MDYYNNLDDLRFLAKSFLEGTTHMNNLFNFLKQINERNEFDNARANQYCLILCFSISDTFSHIPFMKMLADELITKIIIYTLGDIEIFAEEPDKAVPPESKTEEKKEEEKCEPEESDMEQLKKYFRRKYPRFPRAENPSLKYPDSPGKTIDMYVQNAKDEQGNSYRVGFLIDYDGNVVDFYGDPILIKSKVEDYSSIYASLVGQMLDYQKGTLEL